MRVNVSIAVVPAPGQEVLHKKPCMCSRGPARKQFSTFCAKPQEGQAARLYV